MIKVKSEREIALLREAGRIVALCHEEMKKHVKPGVSTWELNQICENVILENNATPSFKGYGGFPTAICASVNEVVVHGIPSKHRILQDGDIVSLDAGLIYKGYHSDAARTVAVGEISDDAKKLIEVTKQSFFEGIKFAKEGNHLNDISTAIGEYARSFGYGVVEELVGHGIGTELHEDPQIPNFPMKRKGIKLQAGMTLAIEPMINMGTCKVEWLGDGWTVISKDHSLSAHYENTILITKDGCEILSLIEE